MDVSHILWCWVVFLIVIEIHDDRLRCDFYIKELKVKKIALLALGALMLSGCTVRVADMTVGSTKNYNLNSAKFVKGARVIGEDTVPMFLVPLGIPNVKTAMDRAIEKNRCAVALSDVVITQLNHAFIVGKIGYRIEGTAIIDRSQPGCESTT